MKTYTPYWSVETSRAAMVVSRNSNAILIMAAPLVSRTACPTPMTRLRGGWLMAPRRAEAYRQIATLLGRAYGFLAGTHPWADETGHRPSDPPASCLPL